MKLGSLLCCLFCASTAHGITVDSTQWPLPDSMAFQFTIFGDYDDVHVQYDPRTGMKGPQDHSNSGYGSEPFRPFSLNRYDTAWTYTYQNQVMHFFQQHAKYSYQVDSQSVYITLDTLNKRILSFHYIQEYDIYPEYLQKEEVELTNLQYSRESIFVQDHEITRHLKTAYYTYHFGMHSNDYGYQNVYNVTKLIVTGTLNTQLLGVKREVASSDIHVSFENHDLLVMLPPAEKADQIDIYSLIGDHISSVRTNPSQSIVRIGGLRSGFYLIKVRDHILKVVIP